MKTNRFLVAASVSLAMAFTFSCSSDDSGDEPNLQQTSSSSTGENASSSSVTGSSGSSSSVGAGSSNSTGGQSNSSSSESGTTEIFVDERDSKGYRWVEIGTQIWMAENLNYDVPNNNGDRCYSDETNRDYCNDYGYGRLYNWVTAQTACPPGWHLPSDAEWTTLVTYVGEATAGTKLKATSGWYDGEGYIAGTDNYGFSALPGGIGEFPDFELAGYFGVWWTSTEHGSSYAYFRDMSYDYEYSDRDFENKVGMFSVRCVKDN